MKDDKFKELLEEIEEFIANYDLSNSHYMFDEDIIKEFSHYKKKHVKKALKELR